MSKPAPEQEQDFCAETDFDNQHAHCWRDGDSSTLCGIRKPMRRRLRGIPANACPICLALYNELP